MVLVTFMLGASFGAALALLYLILIATIRKLKENRS
jgi:hypothetical protein